MGPSTESLALADYLISKLGLQVDRISLAYAIMDHVEVEYAVELAQPSPGGQDAPFAFSDRAKADALEAGQYAFTEADGKDLGYTACIEACVDAICLVLELPEHRIAVAARQPVREPITVEAVATVRRNGDGDRYIDWLTEGGIADLEVGDVLMVSDRAITDEDGSGEVFATPPAQAVDLGLQLDRYDAGLLGDGGGGDVNWWQDYIRAELDRAHEFYQDQADAHG